MGRRVEDGREAKQTLALKKSQSMDWLQKGWIDWGMSKG